MILPIDVLKKFESYILGRASEIQALLNHVEFKKALENVEQNPVFVCGDFNAPSHLDWADKTK